MRAAVEPVVPGAAGQVSSPSPPREHVVSRAAEEPVGAPAGVRAGRVVEQRREALLVLVVVTDDLVGPAPPRTTSRPPPPST